MRKKVDRLWVDHGFAKKVKQKALDNDQSIIDFTRELGKLDDPLESFAKNGKKKNRFNLRF